MPQQSFKDQSNDCIPITIMFDVRWVLPWMQRNLPKSVLQIQSFWFAYYSSCISFKMLFYCFHHLHLDWLSGWLTDWLSDWQSDWLTYWLTDWLTNWLTYWLQADWLIDWLTNWLIDWLTVWLSFDQLRGFIDWLTNVWLIEWQWKFH